LHEEREKRPPWFRQRREHDAELLPCERPLRPDQERHGALWHPPLPHGQGNARPILVAKVVHAQSVLRKDVERTTLRREYLSDMALTTAGLGMIWEQAALQPKLGGVLGRRKTS